MNKLRAKIEKSFGPEIFKGIMAGLAVTATLSIKNRPQCLSLIFVGPSGTGKSVVVESIYDADREHVHRVDDFTPAAFVSHSANKTLEELKEIDLLPKLRNKVMLTKELSPIFNGDDKDVLKNFSVLTAVLDGQGFNSHKGTHGGRGYEGDYLFNWLGATTEVPDRTFHIMGRLGNRLLFYQLGKQKVTEKDLVKFSEEFAGDAAMREVRKLVKHFLAAYFKSCPVNSIDIQSVKVNKDVHQQIVRYATLLAAARAITQTEKNLMFGNCYTEFLTSQPEGPHRLIIAMRMMLCGSALIHGRMEVTEEDFRLIPHIVVSSVPEMRRRVLEVIAVEGELSRATIQTKLGWSQYHADKYMREFASTGIVQYTRGDSKSSTPPKITLAEDYRWICGGLFGGSKGRSLEHKSTPPPNSTGVRGLEKENTTRSTRKSLEGGAVRQKKVPPMPDPPGMDRGMRYRGNEVETMSRNTTRQPFMYPYLPLHENDSRIIANRVVITNTKSVVASRGAIVGRKIQETDGF